MRQIHRLPSRKIGDIIGLREQVFYDRTQCESSSDELHMVVCNGQFVIGLVNWLGM